MTDLGPGYAQNDAHMRDMEEEAYRASIVLRDFEDILKANGPQITLNEWKNQEIFDILMGKLLPKPKKTINESALLNENSDKKDRPVSQREQIIAALRTKRE
jgi:hypothetical protein